MPGTLLLDDWQNAVQDRLNEHIKNLQASTQSALEQVAQPVQQIQQALPQIDPNAIGARLNGLVDSLTQANAQPAAQTFQPIGQNIQDQLGQTLAPVGEAKDAIAQRLQAHVDSLTSTPQMPQVQSMGAQPAAGADVLGGPPSADTLGQQVNRPASGLGPIDASSPSAFARSIAPYAQLAATKLGIDPTWVAAMAGSESNYGKAQGNELFGVKALPGQPGTTMMTHEGEYGGTQQNATFASYASPLDAVNAWVDLIKNHYPGAVNAQDLPTFIHGLRQGGYFTAAEPEYLGIVKSIGDRIGGDVQAGLQAAGIAPKGQVPSVTTAQARAADLGYKDVSQFGDSQLTNAEAYAACGPAAAVRFAERFGRNPTLREATDLAKQTGWTQDSGMAGISSEQNLMTKLGVPTKLVQGGQWDAFAKEAQSGNPVTISTPGHYFFADGYDPQSGAFHVGRSGTDLRGGKEWMTQADMEGLMGSAQGALFADNPQVPTKSQAGPTGTTDQVTASVSQPTALGEAGQRPANEVIPQAVQAIGEGVGQAASNLGSAAQSALGAISEANRVQPGTAALQAAQQVTAPGGPVGQVASDLGSAVSSAYGLNRSLDDQQRRNEQYQQDVQAAAEAMNRRSQEPQTLGGTASGVWGLITGANPPMGISLQQYQDQQQVKNQWIEQNNPAKQLTEAGVPLVEGLTTGLAQQLTDPLMLATFGPTVSGGRAIGAGAARGVEAGLAERLSPQAVQFASTVADKLTSGAFIGGVQNALMEAEKPDATPESVFDALWKGAAFGGVVDVGAAAVTPIARRIGQQLIDQAPELRAALRSRQPAQAEINAALGGAPEAAARVTERLRPSETEGVPSASVPTPERVQAFQPELRPVAAGEVPLYHGGIAGDLATDRPTFLTSDRDAAEFYATERGGTGGRVREATVRPTNPATFDELQATVRAVGATPDNIRANSPYEGENPLDYVYVPAVRRALEQRGFDGVVSVDAIGNREVPVAVTWRPDASSGLRPAAAEAAPRSIEDVQAQHPGVEIQGAEGNRGITLSSVDQGGGAIGGRQRAQADLPFATNLAGAAVGGYAGNAATPEDAPLDVRLRNIGLGASAGLLGTHALTRGGGRLAEAVAARVEGRAPESRGFTAPERPTLEDQLLQARTRSPEGGAPPPAAREPRNLSEVQSNPHLLREAAPGETPMTQDERLTHQDTLSERYQANADRLNAIDELIRNPGKGPERPPWAGGFSNDQVAEMAAKVGRSPFEPLWWEKAGLETGSGEVRAMINESGVQRGMGQKEPTPAELRREAAQLTQDQRHLEAAGEQLATAPDDARLVRPPERTPTGELPFSEGGARDEGAQLAQEVVTKKGGIASDQNQVVAVDTKSGIGGRGIVNPAEVVTEAPSKETAARMPNLNAIGKDMPETIAQIQKSAEDNPELWDHYQQGRISFDSLKNDLAARVGMSKEDWLKTKAGQALNPQEMVALQAAMVEEQARQTDLARTILAKGGVDKLTPEELAYSITQLTQAQALSAVAKGAGSTVARSLNARKISFTRQLASDITAANERKAAARVKAQAERVATRAGDLIDKAAATDKEKTAAVTRARSAGAPKDIVDQIAAAYDELDRYNAMSLHEKAAVFDKLKADRDAAAAARKAAVRGAPEELLSALKQELKAEQDNFAKRKSTWETMAFQDEKAFGNMMDKRTAFRGGLYIETQRKSAQLALQNAQKEIDRTFDAEMRRRGKQSDKAQKLLESMGGVQVTKDLLNNYIAALNDPDPRVAAKFLQVTAKQSNWAKATTLRLAGLLSSPITQMVNIGGNVSGAIVEVPTRALVVGIDALRAAATGGERQAYAGELLPMLKAYGPGMLGALPEAVRTLKTGITAEQLTDPTKIRGRFSPSEKVNTAVEAPLRALQAEDVIFRQAAYSAHGMRVASRQAIREGFKGKMVEERAATILKNLEDYPELAKEAQDAAARQVYQERRTIPGMGTSVPTEQGDISRFASSQVMPFVRTPMNITAQGAGMSPLGVTGVLQAAGKARNMPVGTAAERAARGREILLAEERGARAVIGSAILGGGLALGGAGMLTAAYPADPTEASTLPQGWRPWSLRLTSPVDNNTYYIPLQNMGPMGMPLAMASILTDPKHRDAEGSILDPQEQQRAVMGLGRYVIDNTFLQGISDMVDALHDPKTGASKFLEPWAASYGPYSSLARESQRMMGVASRNPHDGLMGLVEAFEANYPGLSGNVPEATTPLGEPRTQGATGLARLVPVRYDIERDDPTLAVLRENKVGIPPEPKQMNIGRGQSLDLTEDEQAQVKRDRGAAIKQAVDEVQKTRAWQSSDLSARNALLKQAVNYATQNANIRFYQSLTAAEVQSRAKDRAVPEPYYLGAAP